MQLLKNTSDVFLDRVVNKFKENEFEKVERLFDLYKFYDDEVRIIEKESEDEKKVEIIQEFQPELVLKILDFLKNTDFRKKTNLCI